MEIQQALQECRLTFDVRPWVHVLEGSSLQEVHDLFLALRVVREGGWLTSKMRGGRRERERERREEEGQRGRERMRENEKERAFAIRCALAERTT